jgi:hypothetical protein
LVNLNPDWTHTVVDSNVFVSFVQPFFLSNKNIKHYFIGKIKYTDRVIYMGVFVCTMLSLLTQSTTTILSSDNLSGPWRDRRTSTKSWILWPCSLGSMPFDNPVHKLIYLLHPNDTRMVQLLENILILYITVLSI